MTFSIKWGSQALKFVDKLAKAEAIRITTKLDKVALDPFRYLEHFEKEGIFKLRIGKYRSLASVDNVNRVIFIHVLDKRGRIYKK